MHPVMELPLATARGDRATAVARALPTPYIYTGWEKELKEHNLLGAYPQLLERIKHGFSLGSTLPILTHSATPGNHRSVLDQPSVVGNYLDEEVSAGRMDGPFSQEEVEYRLGFFRASPLGVVEKVGSPGKFRIIRDLSFAGQEGTSVNDHLDSDEFRTRWGSAFEVQEIVSLNFLLNSVSSVRSVLSSRRSFRSFGLSVA